MSSHLKKNIYILSRYCYFWFEKLFVLIKVPMVLRIIWKPKIRVIKKLPKSLKLETVFLYMPLILNGAVFQFTISPDRNSLQPKQEHLLCSSLQYLQTGTLYSLNRNIYCVQVYIISRQELFTVYKGTFVVFNIKISLDRNSVGSKQKH